MKKNIEINFDHMQSDSLKAFGASSNTVNKILETLNNWMGTNKTISEVIEKIFKDLEKEELLITLFIIGSYIFSKEIYNHVLQSLDRNEEIKNAKFKLYKSTIH